MSFMNERFTRKDSNIPQFNIKTGVRGGESIEACARNVDYWKKDYYRWFQQAVSKGRLPATSVPYNG
jgi:hypothetical protein